MADQIRKKPRGKQPISRHPLFPPIVALWSAVLFALVGLAIKPAPVVALAFATAGGLAGLLIARKLFGPKPPAGEAFDEAEPLPADPLWAELKSSHRAMTGGGTDALAAPQILDLSIAAPAEEQAARSIADEAIDSAATMPAPPQPGTRAADRIARADLSELSHLELLERLALSLQRRAAANHAPTGQLPPFLSPAAITLPDNPRRDDETVLAEGYNSLQALARAKPAPIESAGIEPAVVFPSRIQRHGSESEAQPATDETEAALRSALATLQRMSGTA